MPKTDNSQSLNSAAPRLAVSALIIREDGKILLALDKKSQQWRAPSFSVKEVVAPEEYLVRQIKTILNLNIVTPQLVAGDLIDDVYLLRFLITDFSGAAKLNSEKYSQLEWFSKEELGDNKKVCPFVVAVNTLAQNYLEQSHYKDKYHRSLADYQNLVKQTAQEKTEFIKYANSRLIEDLLPVYDHLKLSLVNLPNTETKSAWVVGVGHVLKQFKELLNTEGVSEIVTVGQAFDANTMEAIEGAGDIVVKEVIPGYQLNGRLIKAAKVIVGPTPPPADLEPELKNN
ncbi:MAG: nucleotide exchange factor GrpE [Candidatus Parcubacteria bacterium]|jgi:molecular chaperone GrpE|nr:MAG: hypothetical protein JST_5170 [Candidatus Parcubacteria bacterium]